MECFPEETAPVSRSRRHRVSFAEEVTTLNADVSPEFSPVSPPLILPSVDNGVMPELVWMPALPQPIGRAADREVAVHRWRLAREGPFLEERSAESIRSLGRG